MTSAISEIQCYNPIATGVFKIHASFTFKPQSFFWAGLDEGVDNACNTLMGNC